MGPRSRFLLPALVMVLLGASVDRDARGGGFLIYEHGAAATGMADARTAVAGDPSTLYYNPAAITELPGLQLQLGVTGIVPLIHYDAAGRPEQPRSYTSYQDGQYIQKVVNDGENSVDAKTRGFTPIHLYASWRIGETGMTLGFGLNNPFGLGTYWPGDWDGRFIGTETEIQTFFSQPVIAVDLARLLGFGDRVRLSVAAGYDFVYGTARLSRKIDLRVGEQLSMGELTDQDAEMRMLGDAVGHGWNLALYAELPGWVSVGASIRSPVVMPFSGDARFLLNPDARATADLLGMALPDKTTGEVEMTLPWNMNFGLAFLAVENLTIAADLYLALFESYDELDMEFSCTEDGSCSESLDPDPVKKNWGSSLQFCLGAEYLLFDALFLRAGWGLVTSPVPQSTYDPALPDGTRNLVAAGAGWAGSFWKVDLGYMAAFWEGEKDNQVGAGDSVAPEGKASGTYTTVSHILALSLSAWF